MERRLSAIVAADVVGYSSHMERDEAGTFRRLRERRLQLIEPEIARHHGRIFKLMGDGLLAEFGSVVEAVECAVSLQKGMAERNASMPEEERFLLRIGINLGEVIVDGEDRYGEGVNVAARLEQLAAPGGICVSGKVAREVEKRLSFGFDSAGQQQVKNIEEPIDVYHVRIDGTQRRPVRRPKKAAFGWVWLAVPLAIAIAAVAWFVVSPRFLAPPRVAGPLPSIAVLPFKDLSPDKSLGYLGEGVANDIIGILSRFADIGVVSRMSSFAFKDSEADVRKIGTDLGVGFVLEGSVRKEGDRVRITAELIDAKTGANVWAERLDRSGTDLWSIQDEVTGKIVGAMTGEWGAIRKADYTQAWGKDGSNLAEYDYYLRAESALNQYTKEGMQQAAIIARQGLEAYPDSPLLTVELAWARWLNAGLFFSSDPAADIAAADELAQRVLSAKAISPQVERLARWLRAWTLTLKHQHDAAVIEMNKAIALAPFNAFTLTDGGSIFMQAGQPQKAVELADAAAVRDPGLAWFFNYAKGFALIVLGQNDKAAELLRGTDFADAPLLLAIAEVRQGHEQLAKAAVEKMLKANPDVTVQTWKQGYSFRDPAVLDALGADLGRAGLAPGPTN
jgi:TolB-like protein/class 3 adenylate cyclase/tetratricopeptide (TPR) repeat protein